MNKIIQPSCEKIYRDLLAIKFPNKGKENLIFLRKDDFSGLCAIGIESISYGNSTNENPLQIGKYSSYEMRAISKILDYQKNNYLNNEQLAKYRNLSKNTVVSEKKNHNYQ